LQASDEKIFIVRHQYPVPVPDPDLVPVPDPVPDFERVAKGFRNSFETLP
jgi:hypothetical protein